MPRTELLNCEKEGRHPRTPTIRYLVPVRWLNIGLRRESEDQVFSDRINQLDAKIAAAARQLLSTKR